MSIRRIMNPHEEPALNFSLRSLVDAQSNNTASSANQATDPIAAHATTKPNANVTLNKAQLSFTLGRPQPINTTAKSGAQSTIVTSHNNAVSETLAMRQNATLKVQLKELARQAGADLQEATSEAERLRKQCISHRQRVEHCEQSIKSLTAANKEFVMTNNGLIQEINAIKSSAEQYKHTTAQELVSLNESYTTLLNKSMDDQKTILDLRKEIAQVKCEERDEQSLSTNSTAQVEQSMKAESVASVPFKETTNCLAVATAVHPVKDLLGGLRKTKKTNVPCDIQMQPNQGPHMFFQDASQTKSNVWKLNRRPIISTIAVDYEEMADISATGTTQLEKQQTELLNALKDDILLHIANSSDNAAHFSEQLKMEQ